MSEKSSGGNFDGVSNVESLVRTTGGLTRVSMVEFKDGARTWWHSHEGEQVLVVTTGTGVLMTSSGEVTMLRPGVIARIPAGELHWHGAVEGSDMAHVAATVGESRSNRSVDGDEVRAALLSDAAD